MTVSSGFFNSVNHDRLYDAEQLSSIFDGIIVDGVYENYGEALNVKAYPEANSTVIVGTGRAWFDHTWTLNDSQFSITIDPPNELLGRTDAIVIDVDKTQSVRKNSIIYVKGSESTPDLPPAFINTDLHKQYPLCYISRPAGSNKPITQSDITITVGTSVCPMVTGILEAQNLENLMQQLDDEFNTWWDGIKDTLDENTVTNLQNQINEINEKLNSDDALVGLLEKPIAEAFMSGDYGLTTKSFSLSKKGDVSVETSKNNTGDPIYTNKWYGNGYFLDGYRPFLFFLPDGKVAWIYFMLDNNSAGYDTHSIIQVCLATKQGVLSYTTKCVDYVDYTSDQDTSVHDNFYGWNSYGVMTNLSCDVYPVTLDICLSSGIDYYDTRKVGISVIHITITSAGVVNIAKPVIHGFTFSMDSYGSDLSAFRSVWSTKLSSGSTLIPVIGNYRSGTDALYIISKITSNGVVTNTSSIQRSTDLHDVIALVNQKALVIDEIDGKIVAGNPNTTTDYVILDENNLTISAGSSGALTKSPRDNKTNYEIETYKISEANGVQVSSSIVGSNNEFATSQKSKYFIGANNSGDAMPEGTFIAMNDDDRLYGIVTGGKQVAIGTNGGAAVLKTAKSISGSINADNVMKFYKGFINVDSSTGYIQYTGVNISHSAISNPTVFFISREVSDASTV